MMCIHTVEDLEEAMEEDVKKFRDRLPSATLDEQIEYLEEKLEIIQVCCLHNQPLLCGSSNRLLAL